MYLITGCSGAGKSTLVEAMGDAGFAFVREPGRRVIQAGGSLPSEDMRGFLQAVARLAGEDLEAARSLPGPVFFDRGLFDALSGLAHIGETVLRDDEFGLHAYQRQVFFAQPWPEIFCADDQRQHSFADARAESDRLWRNLQSAGRDVAFLPNSDVDERVQFVRRAIAADG